jgi:hypothetical protein
MSQKITTPPVSERDGELRWLADAYQQAQRVRIQTGERMRAVLQGRTAVGGLAGTTSDETPDAAAQLKKIADGRWDGPIPLLGQTYRRHWEAESALAAGMERCLGRHPCWPWLSRVRGIGPVLACKLLARLDPVAADTPSAFWAYCGLATVPGVEYRCATCGAVASFPTDYKVTGSHTRPGGKRLCSGALERARGPDEGVRVAQPKPRRGERAGYDRHAKQVCYLIGTSFLKSRGAYAEQYRTEKALLERTRSDWSAARRHLAALRKVEKLFLAHLWLVWRSALGMPLTTPYQDCTHRRTDWIDPWEMAEKPAPEGRQTFRPLLD